MTTSPASGALPAEARDAFERWVSENGKWPELVARTGERYDLASVRLSWRAWEPAWSATLASREASPTALTDERINALMDLVEEYGCARAESALFNARIWPAGTPVRLSRPRLAKIRAEVAALASTQVAPEGGQDREALRQALGEVLSSTLAGMCEDDVAPDWYDSRHVDEVLDELMPIIRVHIDPQMANPAWSSLAAPAPVAPTKMQPTEDDEMTLIEAQIAGLLEGEGAGEDHANVKAWIAAAGLRESLVCRVHRAISCFERDHLSKPDAAPVAPTPAQPSQWQPIETAPKDGTEILTYTDERTIMVLYWQTPSGCWSDGVSAELWGPTHWMPLPSEPEGEA